MRTSSQHGKASRLYAEPVRAIHMPMKTEPKIAANVTLLAVMPPAASLDTMGLRRA
ncbi:MAG: hypothetical protein Alpg2KO_16080 [Alphaproteobacteria bacterium]